MLDLGSGGALPAIEEGGYHRLPVGAEAGSRHGDAERGIQSPQLRTMDPTNPARGDPEGGGEERALGVEGGESKADPGGSRGGAITHGAVKEDGRVGTNDTVVGPLLPAELLELGRREGTEVDCSDEAPREEVTLLDDGERVEVGFKLQGRSLGREGSQ